MIEFILRFVSADSAGVIVNTKGEMKGNILFILYLLNKLVFLYLATYSCLYCKSSAKLSRFFFCLIGSTVTGPVAKECADLWPRIASNAPSIA